jgi:hypothetical protein
MDMLGILVKVRLFDVGHPIAPTMIDVSAPESQQLDAQRGVYVFRYKPAGCERFADMLITPSIARARASTSVTFLDPSAAVGGATCVASFA